MDGTTVERISGVCSKPERTIAQGESTDLPAFIRDVERQLYEAGIWKNRGCHAIRRRTKLEALLLELWGQREGLRLRDLESKLAGTPQYKAAKDPKREVLRLLDGLRAVGVVEKNGALYKVTLAVPEIAVPESPCFAFSEQLPLKIVAKAYNEVAALRSILLAYKKQFLAHSVINSLAVLRKAMEGLGAVVNSQLVSQVNDSIEHLWGVYAVFAESGALLDSEAREFQRLGEAMKELRSSTVVGGENVLL